MTRRKPSQGRSNPNLAPISPKRGMASGALSLAEDQQQAHNSNRSPDVDGLAQSLHAFRTASSSSSAPPSSQSSKAQTRAANPTKLISLPDVEKIRDKRQWTVVDELGTKENGKVVTVQWKDTTVPGRCIRTDKNGRVYVVADGMRHYIAKRSYAEVDDSGRALWICKWENSDVAKELLLTRPRESPSASDCSERTSTPSASSSPQQPSSPPLLPSTHSSPSKAHTSIESDGWLEGGEGFTSARLELGKSAQLNLNKLQFAVKSDLLDYGPAVLDLIDKNKGKTLCTTTGKAPLVVERRMGKRQVRGLYFNSWKVDRAGHTINLQYIQNAEALLVHMQGYEVEESCQPCRDGCGVMQGCVVGDDFGNGGCTNCHYGGRLRKKCNFRKDTVNEEGYRAAKKIMHRHDGRKSKREEKKKKKKRKKQAARDLNPPKATSLDRHELPRASHHQQQTPDWNANLQFSERDFVYSATAKSTREISLASPSSDFDMTGGLGNMTISPVAHIEKTASRSRSRSAGSSNDNDLPLPKRSKIEIIDLTSSPKAGKVAKSGGKQTLRTPTRRSKQKRLSKKKAGKRPVGMYTPPSSPSPISDDSPHTTWKQLKQEQNEQAVSWPLTPRKGDGGVRWRKMKQEKAHDEGTQNILKRIPRIPSPEIATSGYAAMSSAARLQQRKQKGVGPSLPSSSTTSGYSAAKPSASSFSSDANPKNQAPAALHSNDQRPQTSSNAGARSAIAGASQRKSQSIVDRGPNTKPTKHSATLKPARPESGSSPHQPTTDNAKASGSHAKPTTLRARSMPAPLSTRPHATRGTSSKDSRSHIPTHLLPDFKDQTPVYSDERFDRNTLGAAQFSFIFHRCNSRLQDDLCHCLRWARWEDDVSRSMSLAKFYSGEDRMRDWLNEKVIPTVCPSRPKGGAAEDSAGRRGSSGTEGGDDNENIIVANLHEDSEWVGSGSDDESDESGSEKWTESSDDSDNA